MCTSFQQSQTKMTGLQTKKTNSWRGAEVNAYTHTHSTDWSLHLQGVVGLWITVQVKIRQRIRQTVHISSHNKHYVFMPIQYAQELTQPDGQNNAGTSHLQRTELFTA